MNTVEVECKKCNKTFLKKVCQIKKSPNHFCSRSCANSWNNRHSRKTHGPKRTIFTYCRECGILIPNRHKWCDDHKPSLLSKTIKEAADMIGKQANKYRNIRDHARTTAMKAGLLHECKICGYSKSVVTCHIKEISSFDENTLVSEVNSLSNLVGLCRNHHWEMDNDMLSEEDEKKLHS